MQHSQLEAHDGLWKMGSNLADCCGRRVDLTGVGCLSCNDCKRCAAERGKRLAPRAGRQQVLRARPSVGAHKYDVLVTPYAAMLECIVQHCDISALLRCAANPGCA